MIIVNDTEKYSLRGAVATKQSQATNEIATPACRNFYLLDAFD